MSKELEQRIIELEKDLQDYQKLRGRVSVEKIKQIIADSHCGYKYQVAEDIAQSIVTYLGGGE